jgi:hypothetical protein
VTWLDEIDCSIALKGADHAVDAVARIAKDPLNAPSSQPFDEEVCCLHGRTRSFVQRMENAGE